MKPETATAPVRKEVPPPTERPLMVEAEKLLDRLQDVTQEIARRAFTFFEERGRQLGYEMEDWFRAETEILRHLSINLRESETHYLVEAEVPGFSASEISISAEPNRLIIEGKAPPRPEIATERTLIEEWRNKHFLRTVELRKTIDPAGVTARLENGLLEVSLPKAPHQEPVGIEITAD